MKNFIACIGILLLVASANGQSISAYVTATSGVHAAQGDYVLSWTAGETVIATLEHADNLLTQGFRQGHYEISSVEQPQNAAYRVKAYPNPASGLIELAFGRQMRNFGSESLELKDIRGNVLRLQRVSAYPLTLDFSAYPAGVYFLTVKSGDGHVETLRIVKH